MPTLATSLLVVAPAADHATLTSPSFTPTAGDILVVKAAKENNTGSAPIYGPPTDTQGNTFTLWNSYTGASHSPVLIWTATVGSTSPMTVSMPVALTSLEWRSFVVEGWASAALAGSPATNSTLIGTGAPATTLTTTQTNSAVTWVSSDWAAQSPSTRVYNTTSAIPVEEGIDDKSSTGNYVAYYAYQTAASPGSQTFGLTSPSSQTWAMVGIEILDVPGPGAPQDPNQTEPIKMWQ